MTGAIGKKVERVFIGIPLDKQAHDAVEVQFAPWQSRYPGIRWVPALNRHLTLAFLGDIPIADVNLLRAEFGEAYRAEKRFSYRFSALRRFPNAGGRIIALTGDVSPPLANLFETTLAMLRRHSLPYDKKRFKPHVTLARIKDPALAGRWPNEDIDIQLKVSRIMLYRSTLSASGSVYTALQTSTLV